MAKYKLKVLTPEEATSKGILNITVPGPMIGGKGPDNYNCGSCGNVIGKSVFLTDMTRMDNAAFRCNQCGAVNVI